MPGKITYHQSRQFCNKPNCRRCREGIGHGPYWYAYQTVNGRTKKSYIGKELPPGVGAEDRLADAAPVRFLTLGKSRLEYMTNGVWKPIHVEQRTVRQLLGCLVSSPNRTLPRDEVIRLLWPESEPQSALKSLDQTVQAFQHIIEALEQRKSHSSRFISPLQNMQEILSLTGQTHIWVDADAFKDLLLQARATTDPGEAEHLLTEAAQLYTGDFLPDETHIECIQNRRESLRRSWISLLLELADLRIIRENVAGAIDILDLLLAADPANEAAVQRMMVALARGGRRSEALQNYQRFVTALEDGVLPSQPIQALREVIRKGEPVSVSWTRDSVGEKKSVTLERKRERVGRTHQSPLVGRAREITHLNQLLEEVETSAHERGTCCIVLMGDVGIGKTRLAEEMARSAQQRNWTIIWGTVYTQESTIPYRIWSEALGKALSHVHGLRQEIAHRPLRYQPLRSLLPEAQELLPQEPRGLPEQEQSRLWEAVRALLSAMCEETQLLVVLDDLQWADRSSCDLLAYLVRRMRHEPVLFVGTCRESELSVHHHLRALLTDLQRDQVVEIMPIEPLSVEQIRELLTHLPDSLAQRISDRASGNPFFAEELAREAISHDLVQLPDTIQAVLRLRLERLSLSCQRLLERAAVLGDAFRFETIRAMTSEGSAADEDLLLDLLEEALLAGMLTEEGEGLQATYHFWHPLLLSYLYERISAARRISLHRRVAHALQQLYAGREAEGAAEIIHHLIKGEADRGQIARYAELAADRAYALSAYPSAERYYRLALEYCGELSPNAEQKERLRYIYLVERLGECTMVEGKYEEARQFYERGLVFHTAQKIPASLEDQQYEAQWQALLWCEVSRTWRYLGDNVKARESLQHSENVLREAGVVAGPAWAKIRYQQSHTLWLEGRLAEALRMGEEALERFEALPRSPWQAEEISSLTQAQRILRGDPVGLGRVYSLLAGIQATLGQSADALHYLNKALAVFEENDIKNEIANVCCNLGDLYLRRSEYAQARPAIMRAQTLAEEIGDAPILSIALGNLGVLATRLGNVAEAESWYRKAVDVIAKTNELFYASLFRSYLATALIEQGKLSEAEMLLTQALKISHALRIAPCTGFALVVLGHLRLARAFASEIQKDGSAATHQHRSNRQFEHLLQRARRTLQHALTFDGLESDTIVHGQLLLARIALLLGEAEHAQDLAMKALNEARASELLWLQARAQGILGQVSMRSGQRAEAEDYFQQALNTFGNTGMRLEYARTLQAYAVSLSQTNSGTTIHQQIFQYFTDAHQIYQDCQAALDLQLVEQLFSSHQQQRSPRSEKHPQK